MCWIIIPAVIADYVSLENSHKVQEKVRVHCVLLDYIAYFMHRLCAKAALLDSSRKERMAHLHARDVNLEDLVRVIMRIIVMNVKQGRIVIMHRQPAIFVLLENIVMWGHQLVSIVLKGDIVESMILDAFSAHLESIVLLVPHTAKTVRLGNLSVYRDLIIAKIAILDDIRIHLVRLRAISVLSANTIP